MDRNERLLLIAHALNGAALNREIVPMDVAKRAIAIADAVGRTLDAERPAEGAESGAPPKVFGGSFTPRPSLDDTPIGD